MPISIWYVRCNPRNEAWNFGKLGQSLERADKTSRFGYKIPPLIRFTTISRFSLDLVQWAAL
jgi:hypothetical protein